MSERIPHPRNVAGDFYVEDACCTRCGVPDATAPELFSVDPDTDDCFVTKQPETAGELERMLEVIRCAEFQCIRYRGRDLTTQIRITDLGEGAVCDHLLPELVKRNREIARTLRRSAQFARWKAKLAGLFGGKP